MLESVLTALSHLDKVWVIVKMAEWVKNQSEYKDLTFQEERTRRVMKILLPETGELDVIPARNHPRARIAKGHLTYANEEYAIGAISALPRSESCVTVSGPYPDDPSHSILCLGSSVSNKATAEVLGAPDRPAFAYHGADFRAEFNYSIMSLPDEKIVRLQDDDPMYTTHQTVVVDTQRRRVAVPEWKKVGKEKRLVTDVLLVTRLPRQLGGPEQLVFSPCHGPGLRATKNLFYEIARKNIEALETLLKGEKYFQAMFRVGDLYEKDGTTFPGSIELVQTELAGPIPVKVY